MRKILFFIPALSFAGTCGKSEILGVFPKINGMNCTDYALFIGFVGLISAKLFWDQVTK